MMKDMENLAKAFNGFNSASETLVQYYKLLEEKVKVLTGEVEEKKQLLDSIMNSIDVGVIFFDEHGVIRVVNRIAQTLLGVQEEEVVGKTAIPATIQDEYIYPEKGKPFYAIISEAQVTDGNGGQAGKVMIFNDVTKLRKLEIENERNRRLSIMGEFVLKIAHEIRNPLGSMELYANLLSKDLESTRQEGFARKISSSIRLLVNTLDNMLNYTVNLEPKKEFVNVNEIINEIKTELEELLSGASVTLTFRESISCWMMVNKLLLRQLFINLILNGVQAMPGGGNIIIDMKIEDGASHATFRVEDTGRGMDEEVMERIFEPFYTTKDRGTGLGMSIVKNILSVHGGTIDVKSGRGKGTIFTFSLPIYGKEARCAAEEKTGTV